MRKPLLIASVAGAFAAGYVTWYTYAQKSKNSHTRSAHEKTRKTKDKTTPQSSLVNEATTKDLFHEHIKDGRPTVVDFYAPWCPACTQMNDTFEDAAKDLGKRVTFVRVNIDHKKMSPIIDRYVGRAIPTIAFFDESGAYQTKRTGIISKADIEKEITKLTKP